jgi:hypothetical protein
MSRVSAWFTAMVLLLVAGIASLLSDNTVMALACVALALCMGALGVGERKKTTRR